jgi:ADP-heptose:LPS heptosyltransferase
VPVVGLFGPGEYERFRPWGPDHDVVRLAFSCSPCSQNCLFDEARCIKGISVSLAKAAVARKLEPLRA